VSVEFIAAVGSIISSAVVVVGAFAAVRQLRHLRASNEVSALQNIVNRFQRPEVMESMRFVGAELEDKMRDPVFVEALASNPISGEARAIIPVLNYWESVAGFVLSGAIAEESIMAGFSWAAVDTWRAAAPAIVILRRSQDSTICENFEHLAALAKRWLERRHRTKSKLLRMPLPPSP
jgi:hypothetical protein